MPLLSIVVPVFNEEAVLLAFFNETVSALSLLPEDLQFEIVFVDDGSQDSSKQLIQEFAQTHEFVRLIVLSRNFGHQAALTAGLHAAKGDAIVSIDCDLQDPPTVILQMVEAWGAGADVVLGKRRTRDGETFFKLMSARVFYRLVASISDVPLSRDVGDFRLVNREVLDVLLTLHEASPYYRGLVNWVGFNQVELEYDRDPRRAGETKYSLKKMLRLALSGITSFSDKPLQVASTLGLTFMSCSFLGGGAILIAKLLNPERSLPGFASILLAVLFLGGIQLFSIGILGVYLGVVNQNTKSRPRFVVKKSESIKP